MSKRRKRACAEEVTCAICLHTVGDSEQSRVLPCGHRFHAGCVDRWTQSKPLCPTCREPVPDPVPNNAAWRPGPLGMDFVFGSASPSGYTPAIQRQQGASHSLLQMARDVLCPQTAGFGGSVRASRQTRSQRHRHQAQGAELVDDFGTSNAGFLGSLWPGAIPDAQGECEEAFGGWDVCFRRTAV